jgi:hypothetical protein
METVYMICAAVGGTLIVCQFLVTLLGFGGHHDAGGGHDMGGHDSGGHDGAGHDADSHEGAGHEHHGSAANWFFSMLTFRTLSAACAFFGLAGLACGRLQVDTLPGLAVAAVAGSFALVAVGWVMQLMSRLNVDGTIRIERAVGAPGTVYLSVPGTKSGVGKVHVNVLNRTVEYKAITSQDNLPTGSKIVVVGIVSADTVEVRGQESGVRSHESGIREAVDPACRLTPDP